jgi:hypothetical protein
MVRDYGENLKHLQKKIIYCTRFVIQMFSYAIKI